MRQVILLGALGDAFGKEHLFDIRFPREAISALAANHKGFRKHLSDNKSGYKIIIGKKHVDDLEELHKPFSTKETFTIVPYIQGASSGTGKIFAGIVLIAASIALMTIPGAGVIAGKIGIGLLGVGISTTVGGITQLLTPIPKAPTIGKETDPSFAFGGPVNTEVQGYPIPVVYGRMIVGSRIISAGVTIEEITT